MCSFNSLITVSYDKEWKQQQIVSQSFTQPPQPKEDSDEDEAPGAGTHRRGVGVLLLLKRLSTFLSQSSSPFRYGNYLLADNGRREARNKRKRKRKKAGDDGSEKKKEAGEEDVEEEEGEEGRQERLIDGRFDVSELLSTANTLTRPQPGKSEKKSEL